MLRASLTSDLGPEMGQWKQVAVDADIDIYFCNPHARWQRATNENTNGLLRQYFPKSSDLSQRSAQDLDWVAAELNDRPRKRPPSPRLQGTDRTDRTPSVALTARSPSGLRSDRSGRCC